MPMGWLFCVAKHSGEGEREMKGGDEGREIV